jgi:NADPH:quinone reductase-like Zn-dependent oxidoreductase
MVERVREIAGGAPDFALHTAQVTGALPGLIKIVDGDPRRVMSFADFDQDGLGVRTTGREKGVVPRYDVLGHYAQLAAEGRFTIPIARTFALEDWREALDLSLNKRAHGKLVLLLDRAA